MKIKLNNITLLLLILLNIASCGGSSTTSQADSDQSNTNSENTSSNHENEDGNTANLDTTRPVISLLGVSPVTIIQGESYVDAGATANDDKDGDITANIIVNNLVNTDKVGSYLVIYNIKDEANNHALQVTRTVMVTQAPLKLQFPVKGILNTNFFFSNYIDHDTTEEAIKDFNCGLKTYNGHQGTDIAISDFVAMDDGVEVLAAADGVVTEVHDGEFDRQKEWLTPAPKANYVAIRHEGGLKTLYYHLKKDSIVVSVGQSINAGELLGFVGSSGMSSFPHLHFATYDNGNLVDPFAGACNPNPSLWETNIEYDTTFRVWASGITTKANLTSNDLKEPPVQEPAISISADRVTFWVHVLNAPANLDYTFRFIRPDKTQYSAYDGHSSQYRAHTWMWGYNSVSNMANYPGEWTVEFIHNGNVLSTSTFTLE